jgi:hypothetical protein
MKAEILKAIGKMPTRVDGVSLTVAASAFGKADYTLTEAYHLQEVMLKWVAGNEGDYIWLVLSHPGGDGSPAAATLVGGTTLDVGAAIAPVYAAAVAVEFWDVAETVLLEVAKVASVAGQIVTFALPLALAHATTEKIKALVDHFSPIRGTVGIDGGERFVNAGVTRYGGDTEVTALISAGLRLGMRVKTTAETGDRKVTVSFRFRKPDA